MSEISLLVNKNAIKYLGGPFFGDKTNIFENLIYFEFWFGIIGFGSVNHTEISVSVISVFTRFGRSLTLILFLGLCEFLE